LHNDQISRRRAAVAENRRGGGDRVGDLGTLAAISLVRFKTFRGRLLLTEWSTHRWSCRKSSPASPSCCCFVSMLHLLGWPHSRFTTLVIAHIAFCSAYVTVTVQSRLASADRSLEEAAMDLGSGPVRAFIDTTLPGIAPALASRRSRPASPRENHHRQRARAGPTRTHSPDVGAKREAEQPARGKAGAMPGKVVSMKARTGPEPKSMAASSRERSALARRDCTVTVT